MVMSSNMAAVADDGSKYCYRESKLITSHSDSDSEDAYEVPPELDSNSSDSDIDERSARSSSNARLFVDDSLPPSHSCTKHSAPRKSDSDSNLKSHLLQQQHNKKMARVQPLQQPQVPQHAQTRSADGRVNLGKVL